MEIHAHKKKTSCMDVHSNIIPNTRNTNNQNAHQLMNKQKVGYL